MGSIFFMIKKQWDKQNKQAQKIVLYENSYYLLMIAIHI